MSEKKFDVNNVLVPNGKFFALPYTTEEAELVLVPVPWDVTASLQDGTSKGPESIIEASPNIDFFDFNTPKAWEKKISTVPFPAEILKKNNEIRPLAKSVIESLEKGESLPDPSIEEKLNKVNQAGDELNEWLYQLSKNFIGKGKKLAVVGGEHSVPLGLIKALSEKYKNFGILHIDAHADLRAAYEGFTFSHASIMYNVSKFSSISSFVQVALRDICEDEMNYANADNRFHLFSDCYLSKLKFEGANWKNICDEIIAKLPQKVYISFDIDGLDPSLCPNTGTPVPGGLLYNEAIYLIQQLRKSGKEIIAFDLCEVAPGHNQWDEMVAAKLLYQLSIATI